METYTFTNDDNVVIKLIPPEGVGRNVARFCTRDEHEVYFRRIITFLLKNNYITGNIVDLGAWIGDNALVWAKNTVYKIYAIDPSEENCEFIRQMAALNNLENVVIIQKAISDREEELSTRDDMTHASFNTHNVGNNKIMATTLDLLNLQNVDFIHLDVEGMEEKVIAGAKNLLKLRPIVAFEQHINTDNYPLLVKYFQLLRYRVFLINEVLKDCNVDCKNFIAFPSEKIQHTFPTFLQNSLKCENLLIEITCANFDN